MIVLSDNDIVLKLAGCNLLNTFFEVLSVNLKDVMITETAFRAIPKQANKKLTDDQAKLRLNQFITSTSRVPILDNNLLCRLQSFEDMDGGESRLMLAASQNSNYYLATGDKRCLESLIKNKSIAPLDQVYEKLQKKVYCLENIFMVLISELGFEKVNNLVNDRCIEDGVLKLAFGKDKEEDHAMQCLKSYCHNLSSLLVPTDVMVT